MDVVDYMEGIEITPLRIIKGVQGNVMHGLKVTDSQFSDFGEAYFSTVDFQAIKGWKKHTKMISNLIVPHGEVQFVFYDDRTGSKTQGKYFEVSLSQNNYQRLTVQGGLWMAFKGLSKEQNIVLNLASICHDPNESINAPIETSKISYPL